MYEKQNVTSLALGKERINVILGHSQKCFYGLSVYYVRCISSVFKNHLAYKMPDILVDGQLSVVLCRLTNKELLTWRNRIFTTIRIFWDWSAEIVVK